MDPAGLIILVVFAAVVLLVLVAVIAAGVKKGVKAAVLELQDEGIIRRPKR